MNPSGLSVIILNRDKSTHLNQLLETFFSINSYSPVEIIIVDHDSENNKSELLSIYGAQAFIRLINLDTHYSFAASCNLGAKRSRYPSLLFLKNDIIFTSDVIRAAMGRLAPNGVGAVGIRLDDNPSSGIQHAGVDFEWDEINKFHRPVTIQHKTLADSENMTDGFYPAVTGGFLLCRKKDFKTLGGFYEAYEDGYEDIDLCLRMKLELNKYSFCINKMSLHRPASPDLKNSNHQPDDELFKKRMGLHVKKFRESKFYDLMMSDAREMLTRLPAVIAGKKDLIKNFGVSLKTEYEKWGYKNRLTDKMVNLMRDELNRFTYRPKFSFVIPVYNTPLDILQKTLDSVEAQLYPDWELCIINDASTEPHVHEMLVERSSREDRYNYRHSDINEGIAGATNKGLDMASGDFIVLMDHDDMIERDALCQIAKFLQTNSSVDIIYSDNDKIDINDHPIRSQFKPDWSPELFYAYCYTVHLKVFSRHIVNETGFFDPSYEGSQDYDFFLRAAEKAGHIAHIPLVLYHWREIPGQMSTADTSIENGRRAVEHSLRRQGFDWINVVQAEFAKKSRNGIYQLLPNRKFTETVSIIIPVKNHYTLLKECIESIEEKTSYKNYEIVVADDESDDQKTIEYLTALSSKHKILWLKRKPGEGFNFSNLNNRAVIKAGGEYIVFLNADTTIISSNWIEELLLYCRMPDIGITGAKLLFSNNHIQHGGVIKGFNNGLACPAFKNTHENQRGYMDFAVVPRNYSAVTAACMMIKKELFQSIGGFDALNLPIAYNDVDLCLKVLNRNLRVVYNPYAKLYHYEGTFRKPELSGSRNVKEETHFRKTWGNFIDGYYNINLSLKNEDTFKEAAWQNNRLHLFDLAGQKIKILSVSHNLNFEGAPMVQLAMNRYLNKQEGIELHVLSVFDGPLHATYENLGIKITILQDSWNKDLKGYLKFTEELQEYLHQEEYDIVLANTLATFWAVEAAHGIKVPSVWNIHESVDIHHYFNEYNMHNDLKHIACRTFAKSNRNVFVCHSTAKLFDKYDYFGASTVIHNGIDFTKIDLMLTQNKTALKKELGLPLDKTIVSIIGTVCARKGQIDFARAAVDILKERCDVCFLIVGTRESSYLNQLKSVVNGNDHILLVKETNEIFKYFRVSDLFVAASYNESFPMVILEAMAFALPIVTTPVFGISEQIVDKKTGLFFHPGDVRKMKQNILKFLNEPSLASEMGNMASELVRTNFNEKRMVTEYLSLLETVAFEDANP